MQTKNAIRKEARRLRDELPIEARIVYNELICRRIKSLLWYHNSKELLVYAAIQSEVDLQDLFVQAWQEQKSLYFPKVQGADLGFFKVNSLEELKKGSFDVPEPTDCQIPWIEKPKSSASILVPGVAFHDNGARLGYGKGYYDTFLAKHPALFKVGIAYECQIFRDWQKEFHDVSMDSLITEQRELIM